MDKEIKCTCRWRLCKRHGKCDECIAYHSKRPKSPLPFCKREKKSSKLSKKSEK